MIAQHFSDEVEHTVSQLTDYQIKEYLKNTEMSDSDEASGAVQTVECKNSAQSDLPTTASELEEETSIFGTDANMSHPAMESDEKCSFTCGNPDAQTIHGIMHFFNDLSKCELI